MYSLDVLGQTGIERDAFDAREVIRVVQQALRDRGYAVATNGRWDRATRTALWRNSSSTPLPPAIGENVRWIYGSMVMLRDDVSEALGVNEAGYSKALSAMIALAETVEASGYLEGDEPEGYHWSWFVSGAIAAGVLITIGWLIRRKASG